MSRSVIAILIIGVLNLAVPASAFASAADDTISRTEASTTAFVLPGVIQRSIAAEARRVALQAPEGSATVTGGSHMACRTGAVLLAGAGAAFAVAIVKHSQWTGSGETTTAGAKPPSSVGISVSIGAVLAGAGIFTMAKSCGQ